MMMMTTMMMMMMSVVVRSITYSHCDVLAMKCLFMYLFVILH